MSSRVEEAFPASTTTKSVVQLRVGEQPGPGVWLHHSGRRNPAQFLPHDDRTFGGGTVAPVDHEPGIDEPVELALQSLDPHAIVAWAEHGPLAALTG